MSAEAPLILSFCLDQIVQSDGKRISMQEVFDCYQTWLKERKYPQTGLSVDGFGKLFPKNYQRRYLFYGGGSRRVLLNAELRACG